MSNTLDDLEMETTTGGGGDYFILEPGKHAIEISAVELIEQDNYERTGKEQKLKFTFRTLQSAGEEEGEEIAGKHGIISAWPRWTKYQLTDKPTAGLTILLNQIFGRMLTEEEARRLHFGRLVGIKGFAIVGTGKNGGPRFDSFQLPKNRPVPSPADYFRPAGGAQVGGVAAAKGKPQPKAVEEGDLPDLEDPFAE